MIHYNYVDFRMPCRSETNIISNSNLDNSSTLDFRNTSFISMDTQKSFRDGDYAETVIRRCSLKRCY